MGNPEETSAARTDAKCSGFDLKSSDLKLLDFRTIWHYNCSQSGSGWQRDGFTHYMA